MQGHLVAALDGIEVLSSFSRRCESCLEGRVIRKDQAGRRVEQIQYYHRAVGCQMIHSPVKPFLALEWLRPGEGEETAALRLLSRLPRLYGSRFLTSSFWTPFTRKAPSSISCSRPAGRPSSASNRIPAICINPR